MYTSYNNYYTTFHLAKLVSVRHVDNELEQQH